MMCSVLESLTRGGDPRLLMRRPEMVRIMRRFVMMRSKLSASPRNGVVANITHDPPIAPVPMVTVRKRAPGSWKGYLAIGED